MHKGVKSLLVASLFVGASLYSYTLEEFNKSIATSKHPDNKQGVICEREVSYIKKNPQECLKAAEMLLKSKKNVDSKSTYRFEFYGGTSTYFKVFEPKIYKQTDKEFIDERIANMYSNAGVIYDQLEQHEREVQMYQKALEYDPNAAVVHLNLGYCYYLGQGVSINKI
ncbi:MAG: tetratricopeptide repeat protein, partial [Sulfurimonadaceae bacterium]